MPRFLSVIPDNPAATVFMLQPHPHPIGSMGGAYLYPLVDINSRFPPSHM